MTCSSLPTSSELSLFNYIRPASLGWEHMRNILFFGTINFQGSCGLVYYSTDPLCFEGRIFECFCGKFFSYLCFMLAIKKKCQTSLLFFIVASWWSGLMAGRQTEGQPLIYFLKSPFHKNQWLLFSFFTDFSGDDLHLVQGYRGVSPLFLDSVVSLPGLSWQVVGTHGVFLEWRKEGTHIQGIPSLFLLRGHKFLWSRAERGLVLSWPFVSSPKARILTMEEYQ